VDHRVLSSRYFPNMSVRAYYSPRSLAVFLPEDSIDMGRIEEPAYYRAWLTQRLPVLVHEFQHALDHIGSVAGRQLLDRLSGAYFALERKAQMDISQITRLIDLHDAERLFDRRAYFTEYDPDYRWLTDDPPRWRWGISTGLGFAHDGHSDPKDPLFFVRFTDEDQNALVGRQPITAAALFETRAVYAELEQEVNIARITSRGDQAALDTFMRNQRRLMYEPRLLLYSAPAHFAATHCTDGDGLDAYKIAAYAAGIVLNLAPSLQFEPKIHEAHAEPAQMPRLERLRDRRDPGFLFATLIAFAPRYEGDALTWLDAALDAAGFPPREQIMAEALSYLELPTVRTGGWFDTLYLKATSSGSTNFARLSHKLALLDFKAMGSLGTNKAPIALPYIFLKDGLVPSPVEPLVEPNDQLELLDAEIILDQQLDEFVRACR